MTTARRIIATTAAAAALLGTTAATAGAETWTGTWRGDYYRGTGGSDTAKGLGGADTMSGGRGDDLLDGGEGGDRLSGGAGADRLVGGPGTDSLSGGDGNDTLHADDGRAERVTCGAGSRDVAEVDWLDDVDPTCEDVRRPEITYAQLQRMFGSKLSSPGSVEAGLPALNEQMRVGSITTPRRASAFLATLVNESGLRYRATEYGSSALYRGRGYVQLTGSYNYGLAGRHFGQPFRSYPSRVATLTWSAKVARWYWHDHRNANPAADDMDMGLISRKIGYRWSSGEDWRRCEHFKRAMTVLTGTRPSASSVTCYRH